jgi:hypothetical protein
LRRQALGVTPYQRLKATYGFKRRPWWGLKVLADGASIRDYLVDTAHESGIDEHIHHGLKITRADWSSAQQRWTVSAVAEARGEAQTFRCRQLTMSTGYYNHDAGYCTLDARTADALRHHDALDARHAAALSAGRQPELSVTGRGAERRRFDHRLLRAEAARRREAGQLDPDCARQGLVRDPAAIQPARTVLRQELAAERGRNC